MQPSAFGGFCLSGSGGEVQQLFPDVGVFYMAVNIQGDTCRGVTHEVLHAFDIQPAVNQAGAVAVAQDVRGERRNGRAVTLAVAPVNIAEDAVEIHAVKRAGAVVAGK